MSGPLNHCSLAHTLATKLDLQPLSRVLILSIMSCSSRFQGLCLLKRVEWIGVGEGILATLMLLREQEEHVPPP